MLLLLFLLLSGGVGWTEGVQQKQAGRKRVCECYTVDKKKKRITYKEKRERLIGRAGD